MIKEFTIAVRHKINLGNYESIDVEASITVAVPDTANANEAALNALKGRAQVDLRTLATETLEAQKRKTEQRYERTGYKTK